MGHTGDGPPNTSNWRPQIQLGRREIEFAAMEAELAALKAELADEKALYQSLASHVEVHEGELKDEVANLRKLVREMGTFITAIRNISMGKIKVDAEKIINRPEVKEIMETGE